MTDSTPTDDTVNAHSAVEMVLSHRASNEPGFVERLALDPKGVVTEVLQEVGGDQNVDLGDANVNIHVQTPGSIHFVCNVNPEVSGFAGSYDLFSVNVLRPIFGAKDGGTVGNNTTTHTPCHTNACTSKDPNDAKCQPASFGSF